MTETEPRESYEQLESCPPEARRLFEWADDALRDSIKTVNDALRQMVTLTVALLAGSAAMLNQLQIHRGCKTAAAVLLLVCLAISLWGHLPRTATVDTNRSDEIKTERDRGLAAKSWCLRLASACLFAAFVALISGVLLG